MSFKNSRYWTSPIFEGTTIQKFYEKISYGISYGINYKEGKVFGI
jgi:hypothetical protein